MHSLPTLPPAWPWSFALLAALLLLWHARHSLFVALLLGFLWAWFSAATRLAADLPRDLEGEDLLIRGQVASLIERGEVDPQFVFDVASARRGVPPRLRLAWYESTQSPRPGEVWQLVVRLKRRSGFANPGGFDYEAYLFREAIGATGYVRQDERNLRLAEASGYFVPRARAWLAQRIAAACSGEMLGILQGLAVGETQAMRARQWRILAATGTTHLMAISGLHISMLAALAAWCGGAVVRWRSAQRRRLNIVHGQAVFGLLAAVGYSVLAGFSVPTQRTMVMLCVYFAARALRRHVTVGQGLGLALIAVLLIDPFAPLAVGAWLSFGAVAVLLVALSGRLQRGSMIGDFGRVQWAVSIGLLPLLLATFGSVSLVSPLANAVAVPFFTVLMVPLVLLGTTLAAIWLPAGHLVLGIASWLLEQCWPLLEWLARQSLAVWYFPSLPALAYLALAVGAALLLLPNIWPVRAAGALLCIPVVLYRPAPPGMGEFELAVLDVGQGLAAVVRTHSHTLVYDMGPAFRSGRDTGELVVVPYLRHRGVRRIDMAMVSHGDLDHRGGLDSLLAALPAEQVIVGPSVHTPNATSVCRQGRRWRWDGVDFEVLHPGPGFAADDNDSSCVLRVSVRGGAALLTGDIEATGETQMLDGLQRTEVVVVPHHGSRSSSTPEFVRAVGARIALFSAGYRNRWDFPKPDVVERWRQGGADTWSTLSSGAIELAIGSEGVRPVREYRHDSRRYWRRD